jgi:polyisoprenyl-teichoic acid--peptidoglycan teichoic acid transferase
MYKRFKRLNKRWQWFITLILIICLVLLIWLTILYWNVQSTSQTMYASVHDEHSVLRVEPIQLDNDEPFSVLLLGVDKRAEDSGRSDTILVATVNPKEKTTKMLSVPRDTFTQISGTTKTDKINHAYAFGGLKMTKETIEQLLNIPIDYAVAINMEGFVQTINLLGGVEVENPFSFTYEGEHFEQGPLKLDGELALKYVRMRYEDPQGDFGRQNRQKQVLQSAMDKAFSLQSIFQLQSMLEIIGENVETNVTLGEMIKLNRIYKSSTKDNEQLYINVGQGKLINGIYYFMANEQHLKDTQSILQAHLMLNEQEME